jgi:DNA-binding response OmpR family regulator
MGDKADVTHALWAIELRTPNAAEPLKLNVDRQIIVGRYDVRQEKQPDLDLAPFHGEEDGVSRQHMALVPEGDQLMVVDLGSGNGTYLNGERLEPNKPTPIKHDDRLQLGQFQLHLRVVVSPTRASGIQQEGSLQEAEDIHPGDGQFILIVEDDNDIAELFSMMMVRAGYTTHVCRDVLSAIRTFNHKRPSAIILDLMLPDMHGLEFCRYVRRDTKRNATPIVVVSAAKTADSISNAMQAGADLFLAKPLSATELGNAVTSLVKQHESGVSSLHTKMLVGTAPLKAVSADNRSDTVVVFIAGHSETPMTVTLKQPVTFGRAAGPSAKHHIDLTRYQAIDNGVSRVHLTLMREDGQFFVEDNNSVNGTFVDGDPIKPLVRVPLHNACELRLGQLRLYLYFLTDEDKAN